MVAAKFVCLADDLCTSSTVLVDKCMFNQCASSIAARLLLMSDINTPLIHSTMSALNNILA